MERKKDFLAPPAADPVSTSPISRSTAVLSLLCCPVPPAQIQHGERALPTYTKAFQYWTGWKAHQFKYASCYVPFQEQAEIPASQPSHLQRSPGKLIPVAHRAANKSPIKPQHYIPLIITLLKANSLSCTTLHRSACNPTAAS